MRKGEIQQLFELHEAVAVDAGVGRAALLVGADEFVDDLLLKIRREVEDFVGNIELKGDLARVLD